ncbi:MAG: 4-hydroxybutyrate CoA-transferase [Deltaproteobacteria bacterium]|nr:4-hydroxybutyrate CoA-transferase [Deltaproteobacteria bacterium]
MRRVSASEAIHAIPDGSTVIFPGSVVDLAALVPAFQSEVERFHRLTVYSGYSFGDYRFLDRGLGKHFRYATWQAAPHIRKLFAEGRADYVPIRFGEVHRVFSRSGPIPPDVVLVQVSPPRRGEVSLGVSVSLYQDFIRAAKLVIAEINPRMPRTAGDSRVPVERIDLAVESDAPLVEYRIPPATARDQRIVDRVLDLVPDRAWVQLGIGSVPDRVLARLGEKRGVNLFSGMLSQGLQRFVEEARHTPKVTTGELAGNREFYEFCGRRRLVRMATTRVTHDVATIARLPRFVSVNSTVEVDLQGQANGEAIGPVQISGVGGSLDYMEGAALSAGGLSLLALPSTTDDGKRSRIVARLAPGAPVTTPRYAIDTVVTEYGAARLKGRSLRERAEALVAIAHPDFRDELARAG